MSDDGRYFDAQSDDGRYRLLVDAITDYAIYMLDPDGVVTSWNAGAQRFKGYQANEIVGQHFSRFYSEEDRAAGLPQRGLAAAAQGGWETEGWRVRKDGTRFWAHVVIDAIKDESGQLLAFGKVTRDVTEKMESERALAEAREALFQSQKMEVVGQLTGGVAHDFNNLLTVILGGLDTARRIRESGGDPARLDRGLEMARQAADRATALTARLLAFSRRQPLKPEPADLNVLVRDMTDLLHRTLGETVELEGVLTPRLWPVEVDGNQLESAILNLAINARDAMASGGKLTIETGNALLDDRYVATDSEVVPGQYVMVAISDTGMGMDADTLTRVFEPFFTTKEVGKGTGLGLSMVYGFVKQSGGHVTIYSEPGKGTTVKLYFPRFTGEGAAHVEEKPVHAPLRAYGETILVVEDNEDVRAYSVMILTELGYGVLEAVDADEALPLLASDRRIDLLFTDVVLPGRSGRVLADGAVKIRPALKVLFTTGYSRNAIVHHGRLDPGVRLITKPFTFDQLAECVRHALDLAPA